MRGSAQFIEEFNFVEDIDEPIKESDKNINMTRPRPSRNLRPVPPVFNKKEISCYENAPLSYIVKTKVSTTIRIAGIGLRLLLLKAVPLKMLKK
ncbi:hypothetical protein [Candidatus Endomicrobiellum devescovinae]|jgi:hypothetical protein|uniref:hypothetical protein n=1 Tax=Candidatus Endomicrobiellum devescovinae TaxID=3242322 RepID=UPI00281BDFD7|nr:hypothetical protein [Endomicrobium sp.]